MKKLLKGLSGLLLINLSVNTYGTPAISFSKSNDVEKEVTFESCYQQILKADSVTERFRNMLLSFSPTTPPHPVWQNCSDLFKTLSDELAEASQVDDSPAFFHQDYYDFILDERVIATVRAKLNGGHTTTDVPYTGGTTGEVVTTDIATTNPVTRLATTTEATTAEATTAEATTTEATATDVTTIESNMIAGSGVQAYEKQLELSAAYPFNEEALYSDAQIKALIVNTAHLLMSSSWSLNHFFCVGPFLEPSSYLGCNAVMAKYHLMHPEQLDYYVLAPGVDSEQKLKQWIDQRGAEDPQAVLAVSGHINVLSTINLEGFRGIAGLPDLSGDDFDPAGELSEDERPKLSMHTDFKSDCEAFTPDSMFSLFCNHGSGDPKAHLNGMLSGDNPSISGVDIEARLQKVELTYDFVDSAGKPGSGHQSYPSYLIYSESSGASSIVNSHIRLWLESPVTRTFDKQFRYEELIPPKKSNSQIYLFYTSNLGSFIFSKNVITLNHCSDDFSGIPFAYGPDNSDQPRINVGNRVQDGSGSSCYLQTTASNITSPDTPDPHNDAVVHKPDLTTTLVALSTLMFYLLH